MNLLWGLLVLALAQDGGSVTLTAAAPTDSAWPIRGKVDRPDESVVRVSAVRLERRWDAKRRAFAETATHESRLAASAKVAAKGFEVSLKKGAPGAYRVTVAVDGKPGPAERVLLGKPLELLAGAGRQAPKLAAAIERLGGFLDEIEQVAQGKKRADAKAEQSFVKRLTAELQALEEASAKTDLTATAFYLRELASHLLNAQVWTGAPAGELEQDGDLSVFVDPDLNSRVVRELIGSGKGVLSLELRACSAAALLALLPAAEEPKKALAPVREAARDSARLAREAPERDADFEALLESAASVEEEGLEDLRARLQAALQALVPRR